MREFEITQLAQRNNFFMIFQGVLLAGVIQSAHSIPAVSFLGLYRRLFHFVISSWYGFWCKVLAGQAL